jgi:hypothetical protein
MRVNVLGCGPAGLIAAHSAAEAGCVVFIYSKKEQSKIVGAQFLHRPIPGITNPSPDAQLVVVHSGTAEGYAKKVYDDEDMSTSFTKYPYGHYDAWDMDAAYAQLWDLYSDSIIDTELDEETIDDIEEEGGLCITSIPAHVFCKNHDHFFMAVECWVRLARGDGKGWQPEIPENTIFYNGETDIPWYRASNVFGRESQEFKKAPDNPAQKIYKPTVTNCDCRPDWVRVGRFGKWKRGVLVNHAYGEVKDALLQVQ